MSGLEFKAHIGSSYVLTKILFCISVIHLLFAILLGQIYSIHKLQTCNLQTGRSIRDHPYITSAKGLGGWG